MARSNFNRKPNFLWQGLLIVFPVVVLAAVGVFSLRQDKILAQHEATERAQAIADDLVPRIWKELTSSNSLARSRGFGFLIDSIGQLVFPPPFDPVPQAFDSMMQRPENPQAIAKYDDALLLTRQGKFQAAADAFDAVLEDFPGAVGETGLELAPLAQWKLLELQRFTTNHLTAKHLITLDSFCSNLVYHPTPLTPHFLQLASERDRTVGDSWQRVWENHEWSRTVFSAVRPHLSAEAGKAPKLLALETKENALSTAIDRSPNFTMPWFFWFKTQESWDRGMTAVVGTNRFDFKTGEPSWLAIRYHDIPTEAADRVKLTVPDRMRLLKSSIDHPPVRSKNIITHELEGETGRAMTQRVVTLDNQEAVLSKTRATPIFKTTRGRNSSSLERVEGPASPQPDNMTASYWFVCHPESEIGPRITALANAKQVPEYFGVGVELAGRRVNYDAPELQVWYYLHYGGKTGGERKEFERDFITKQVEIATNVLASATRTESGVELMKVSVYLSSPTTLFYNQRTRTFWFGSLIAVSAVAALIGLLTAWRAFNRQLQLGEMKSNFVSSVSHELRAPIASVRLMAESLERGKISGEQKQSEYFRFIVQECRRLTSLIENVLDFSRIEQGRKEYEFEPTDLVALVQQTVKLMDTYAAERGVSLSLTVADPQLSALDAQPAIDGKAVQQALVNLIDNAIKHSPKGETVTVGLEVQSPESRVQSPESAAAAGHASHITHHAATLNPQPAILNLFVEDHGEGIPPEEHEKIFERFYRLGSELRRETQGVGIGLSIVKHIVEAHGGNVIVRSAVGQGSRFTIELPASKNETTD